jgi:hypothetical protein
MGAAQLMIVEFVDDGSPRSATRAGVIPEKSDFDDSSLIRSSNDYASERVDIQVFEAGNSSLNSVDTESEGSGLDGDRDCGQAETVPGLSLVAVSAPEYPPEPRQTDADSATPTAELTPNGGRRQRKWKDAIAGVLGRGGSEGNSSRVRGDSALRRKASATARSMREKSKGFAERTKGAKEGAAVRAREVLSGANRVLTSAGNSLKSGSKLPSLGRLTPAGTRRRSAGGSTGSANSGKPTDGKA